MTKYANWFPKWLVKTILVGLFIFLGFCIYFIINKMHITGTIFIILTIIYFGFFLRIYNMYKSFDLNNKDSISWRILNYVANFVKTAPNKKILDIGCGSGALSIECAKRNKDSLIIGMDRWGKEYKDFSKSVCEHNAKEENVLNTRFQQGDITKLAFEKESFDFITSNYVIHNVPGDKVEMIINILDLLKKGGSFAIHDIFTKSNYPDPNLLVQKLKDLGFQKVELISTTEGTPMSSKESKKLMLNGSKLLYGIK